MAASGGTSLNRFQNSPGGLLFSQGLAGLIDSGRLTGTPNSNAASKIDPRPVYEYQARNWDMPEVIDQRINSGYRYGSGDPETDPIARAKLHQQQVQDRLSYLNNNAPVWQPGENMRISQVARNRFAEDQAKHAQHVANTQKMSQGTNRYRHEGNRGYRYGQPTQYRTVTAPTPAPQAQNNAPQHAIDKWNK